MKTRNVLIIFLTIFISLYTHAQNVDVKLAGSDSTKAFYIINDNGDTLFTIRGDGGIKIGKDIYLNTPDYLLNIDGEELFEYSNGPVRIESGGSIYLKASRASHLMTDGGSISIGSGESPDFGNINIQGGSDDDGVGAGEITINPGDNADLNLYGGGYGSSGGFYGGDVNIKASDGGYAGDVNIESGIGDSGADAGDINITGGLAYEERGGDIILTPGLGISGGTNGSVQINGSGTYTGSWTQISDEKCKKNINPLKSALKKIDQLRGVEFNWKLDEYPNKNFDSKVHVGLIAQEVEKIAPDLVVTNTDDLKSVEYSKLTVYLVEAMKEQQTMIEELNKKIEQLEKDK